MSLFSDTKEQEHSRRGSDYDSICEICKKKKKKKKSAISLYIWLKIEHLLQNVDDDLYLGCVYIPPNNSSFYRLYDCDIFGEFENQTVLYLAEGKVMILGDLNARTSTKADFIADDILNTDSQYKGAYAVFFKEKINLVMRNSNNRF
jgi:hypothetical protein